jgi:hypothetical protein
LLLAVLPGQQRFPAGEEITLSFDPSNLHDFDENGLRAD